VTVEVFVPNYDAMGREIVRCCRYHSTRRRRSGNQSFSAIVIGLSRTSNEKVEGDVRLIGKGAKKRQMIVRNGMILPIMPSQGRHCYNGISEVAQLFVIAYS
jgi:hypothetical protein